MNTLVVLEGTLVAAPTVKTTSGGKSLAEFEVQVENGAGQYRKDPYVFRVKTWEPDTVSDLAAGAKLTVFGRLTTRSYDWQGQTKTAMEIIVKKVDVWNQNAKSAPKSVPDDLESVPF